MPTSASKPVDLGPFSLQLDSLVPLLRADMRDDWYPDPLNYSDIIDTPRLAEFLDFNCVNNSGQYFPSTRELYNLPKPNFTIRTALEMPITDRAIYQGLASKLLPFFDPLLPVSVYSHRHSHASERIRYSFRRGVEAWQDFLGVVRLNLTPDHILLSTDLTNFYDNIDLAILRERITELVHSVQASREQKTELRKCIRYLFRCLKAWTLTPKRGLPQNRDASSFLANIYMLTVDNAMLLNGYDYHRYMDDIKIVCSDKFVARKALKTLIVELRKLGLAVNPKKTQFCTYDEAFSSGGPLEGNQEKIQRYSSIWGKRSENAMLKIAPNLARELVLLIEKGDLDGKEFRFYLNRMTLLAGCVDFKLPSEFFADVTQKLTDAVLQYPSSTLDLVKYLSYASIAPRELEAIESHLLNPIMQVYSWQSYHLWVLLARKQHRSDRLIQFAVELINSGQDTATRAGASLYMGSLGQRAEHELVAKKFHTLKSYIGQRVALIACHPLHYRPLIEEFVAPFLRSDLKGLFKSLHKQKTFLAPLAEMHISQLIDSEVDS